MRVPVDVLERVRGVMVVAALAGCAGEPVAAPPVVPEAVAVVVATVEPVDPVGYAADDESARLARLDQDEQGASSVRNTRVARIVDAQRQAEARAQQLAWRHVSMACGRG